jgi:hypothetical protein
MACVCGVGGGEEGEGKEENEWVRFEIMPVVYVWWLVWFCWCLNGMSCVDTSMIFFFFAAGEGVA